ncbi:exopolyphosphatase [Janibacter sp. G56]|uniref:Ppx/GppA phosphatase family protein n=1 Tax=Janibacter sp. G56 TaxID=3418717 RepID=UPI003D04B9C6
MMRVGAIDCGTNSIRLLVADVDDETGAITDILRRMEVVRLGQGVDRTGRIDPVALERTLAMALEYAGQCRELGAQSVRFVATSASRDAENASEFVAGVESAFEFFGTTPEVVSGDEEARLSFAGATGDLRAAGIPGPYLVVDLGGGSTEFVRGTTEVVEALSVDMGCVRMTERHLHDDPPTEEQVNGALGDIERLLDEVEAKVGFGGAETLVGLAGSVTTITAHALGLEAYEPGRIHLAELPAEELMAASSDLLHRSRAQRAELGFMHSGRVDVIGAGALVWHAVIRRTLEARPGVRVVTSEHDILDGIALSAAGRLAGRG